ncbi:hypothetical protein HUT18_15630 [Streptomyces sp. NA04227]|uniref:DUF5988 family protein n=1 Tax=Streptomyces sp. NA04227 TaxID=2742136 RepID=UPI001590C7CD|nr:DUF5988 family protein [Streptomyces sp. NA04227]QKW07594.1 hypothetical protein HUT18_15630 [Streptomyces sp. NA04227]
MADTADKAVLKGGPEDLDAKVVSVEAPDSDELKIQRLGGYEHFRATKRTEDTTEGPLPVYEWWERTEMPG